ncbi:MAG: transposase [Candidatus Omnitrophica bacterium]|nr:transposase [Candidatus Omnitrophota bacterium]
MPAGPRLIVDEACYHIVARGNQKRPIFKDDIDFREYLERVKRYKRKHGFRLYAFCLMPNHIHILGQVANKHSLSKFMQSLTRSYTAYFNHKYEKVGYLWQGRFKSKIINRDKYLLDCINYIEFNPIRANLIKSPHNYLWSSYKERVFGGDQEKATLDPLRF